MKNSPILQGAFTLFVLLACCAQKAYCNPPFNLPEKQELARIRSAVLYTSKGNIVFRLFPKAAPWHVANFKYLADKGFYRNLSFHMGERDYAIQGGAPGKRKNSGPGYTIPAEFNRRRHVVGSLSMVRKPDDLDVNRTRESHGSQFRILLRAAPHMDGRFVVFGQVIQGLNVAKKLRIGDQIKDLKVFVKAKENSAAALP